MDVILATRNKHKVFEISKILGIKLKSLLDLKNPPRIIENGKTFAENARKKARTIAHKYKVIALADDSGLMVDALSGAPGVKSARYAGPYPTPQKLCTKLLRELSSSKSQSRKAQFVCTVAIVEPSGKEHIVEGKVSGTITKEMRGSRGFGYDPVFVPRGYKKTFAEMKPETKNRLSHRGRAFRKAAVLLNRLTFTQN